MEYIQMQLEYGGKFVALQGGKVVSARDTFKELLENMEAAGIDDEGVVFQYIEPEGVAVVY